MRIFSVNFWVGAFINTFITIICLYLLKMLFAKVQVPVVSEVVESV